MTDEDQGDLLIARLRHLGLIPEDTQAIADRPLVDLNWDTFQWAQFAVVVRSLRPQFTDDLLRTMSTIEDARSWVRSTEEGGSAESPRRRRCELRAVLPEQFGLVYAALVDPRVAHRWRLRGTALRPSDLEATLFAGTLTHYFVSPSGTAEPEGYLALYAAQLRDGFAYFGFQRLRPGSLGAMYEGAFLFMDHCFATFDLRKIYVEVPGYNLSQFQSLIEEVFVVDAVIEGREYFDGKHWPLTIAHLSRDRWLDMRERWAAMLE